MATNKFIEWEEKGQEVWVPVVNQNGYKISNLGRIKTKWIRYTKHNRKSRKWKIVNQRITRFGYCTVWINKRYWFVHELMLLSFIGPRPEGKKDSRHLDDVKTNNVMSNLRWGSRQENMNDAVKNGR